jgi:hypothetical protein
VHGNKAQTRPRGRPPIFWSYNFVFVFFIRGLSESSEATGIER